MFQRRKLTARLLDLGNTSVLVQDTERPEATELKATDQTLTGAVATLLQRKRGPMISRTCHVIRPQLPQLNRLATSSSRIQAFPVTTRSLFIREEQ